jgi:hypothetical protein
MKRLAIGNSIVLPYLLILAVIVLRVAVSHPFQFVPIFSCLIFFGACRPAREFAMPVLALVGVDIFLTTHQYGYVLTAGHAVTWLWYLGAVILGAAVLGNSASFWRAVGSPLAAAVSFFIVSNFTVWAEWAMYPRTWSGLGTCYAAGLPFFRNSIVAEGACGLLIYAAVRASEALAPAAGVQSAHS